MRGRVYARIGSALCFGVLLLAGGLVRATEVCGDVNDDGLVDLNDVSTYRQFLADPVGSPLSQAGESKCRVTAASPDCDILQLTVLRRALEVPPLPPGIAPVCSVMSFTPEPNYAVHVGQMLTFTVSAASGITASGLPAGATFDGTTLSWAPTNMQADETDEPGAFREGRYTVTFTAEGTSVDVKIGVSKLEIVGLDIDDLTIGIGGEAASVVTVIYSDGTTALGAVGNPITPAWETADPAIAEVFDVFGPGVIAFVRGLERGSTTLTTRVTSASLGELSATSTVAVLGVNSIAIDPPMLDFPLDASDVLQATAILEDGSGSTSVPFVWSSSDPAIVSVSGSSGGRGIVVGNSLGSATITASADGLDAFADATVTPPTRTRFLFGLDVIPPFAGDSRFVLLDTVGAALPWATLIGPYFMEETDSERPNALVVSAVHQTTLLTAIQKVDASGGVTVAHEISSIDDFVTDIRLQDDGTIYVAADDGRYTFSRLSPSGQVNHIGKPSGSTPFGDGTLGLAGGDVVFTGPWDFEYTQGAAIIGTASLVARYDPSLPGARKNVPVAVASWPSSPDTMVALGGVLYAIDSPSKVVYRFLDLNEDGDHFFTQDSTDEFGNPQREALEDAGERQVFANLPLADFTLRADLATGELFAVRVTGVDPKRILMLQLVDLNGDGDADDTGEQIVLFDAAAPAGTSIRGIDLLH